MTKSAIFVGILLCVVAIAYANSIQEDVMALVKALSFADLKSMKKVPPRSSCHKISTSPNTHLHIAADADFDFKERLDSEDRAWMHLVAMFWPGPKIAAWMIKQGAEVDPEDIHYDTPLLYCVSEGNLPCAQFLLKKGAKPAGRPASSTIYQSLKHRHEFNMFNHGKNWTVPRGRNEHSLRDAHYQSNPQDVIKLLLSLGVSPTAAEHGKRPHILVAADYREFSVLEDMLKISGHSGADLFSDLPDTSYAIGGGNALHAICALSPYIIHVSKIIIGHLNSGSNKTGVENQAHISKIRSVIDSAFASGASFGPNIPWRPVDYFDHMKLPSEDVLKCSVSGDSSVDRQCLQDVMSSWNAKFTQLILQHSKTLLPLQRDLRGETPLEVCAAHGDNNSMRAMLQFVKDSPQFDVNNADYAVSISKAITAAATSHWQSVASLLTQFASSLSLKLPSLNLPPVPSIACFSPNNAEPPLKTFSVVNSMKSPNDAPDPHVPVCRDPNQPLESSVNPPPLLSRQILKDQPAEQLLGGWGGAVFDVFDGACGIDQVDAGPGGVSMETFQSLYVQQRRPVLLRNATGSWPVMKWWRRTDFQYIFNSTSLDVFVNEKALGGVRYSDKIPLHKFVQHMDSVHAKLGSLGLENESAEGILKRYAEIGLPNWLVDTTAVHRLENMIDDVSKFDDLFSGTFAGDAHAFQLMIAPPLTGASMHFHYTAANALIYGAKRWFLINPAQAMYSSKHALAWVAEDVPALRKQGVEILECTQMAGDILYVPSMWGHSVLYLSNTIGVAKLFSH